jgi:hypothetical protein
MSKIVKVGDKVKITYRQCGHKFEIGQIVEIIYFSSSDYIAKGEYGKSWCLRKKEFEIIEEPTQEELIKAGDKVKITDRTHRHEFEIGKEVQIIEVNGYGYKAKGENGESWYLHREEFEPTEEPTKEELIELAIEKGFLNGARIKSTMGREGNVNGNLHFCNEGSLYSNSGDYCIYDAETRQWATILNHAPQETEIDELKSQIKHLKELQRVQDKEMIELQDSNVVLQSLVNCSDVVVGDLVCYNDKLRKKLKKAKKTVKQLEYIVDGIVEL